MIPSFTEMCAACCKWAVCLIVGANSFLTILDLSIASTACDMAALHSLVGGLVGQWQQETSQNSTGLGTELEWLWYFSNDTALRALSKPCASVWLWQTKSNTWERSWSTVLNLEWLELNICNNFLTLRSCDSSEHFKERRWVFQLI